MPDESKSGSGAGGAPSEHTNDGKSSNQSKSGAGGAPAAGVVAPDGEKLGATIGQATTALDPKLQRTLSPTDERRVASLPEPEPRPRNLTEEQIEDSLFGRFASEGKSETDARHLAQRRAREMTLNEDEAAERRPKRRASIEPTPVFRQKQPDQRTRGRREADS